MAWLRIGDNATTHPLMSKLLVATDLQHPQKNEAFGVLVQLAAVSAGHLTDAVVELGLLAQIAPGRERAVLDTLKKAGLATEETIDGRTVIRLVLDDEEFIHARRREEVEQDRNRAKDKRTPGLLARVRVRDGDRCRWCGKSVSWTNRTGYRAATYDSLTNHKDSTVDTLVVSCKSCNSQRGDGIELPLLNPPTPEEMIYGRHTVDFVNNDPWCKDHGVSIQLTQPTLPLDTTQAAASRQQQDGQAAAPSEAAALDHRAAPEIAAPDSVGDQDEPPWMTQSIDELHSRPTSAAAPSEAAARTPGQDDDQAAASRKQQDGQAAAPSEAAALDHRAAPEPAAPDGHHHPTGNEVVTDLGRVLGRLGDGPKNVGSGRDGPGRAGTDRTGLGFGGSGRRRRGKRGGKRKRDG